jgi:hypothetical protein
MSQVSYDGQHLFVGGESGNISGVVCAGTFRELNPATGGNIWKDCPVLGAVTGLPGWPSSGRARRSTRST